jgi:hypothetical protein
VRGKSKAGDGSAHYDREQTFPPGTHQAEINLAVAAERARPGGLDLSQVWRSQLFVEKPTRPRTIYLHRVWLE